MFPKDSRGADWPGDGLATLDAGPQSLNVQITASSPDQLVGLKQVMERHLDRFAFREAPLQFDWK